MELEQIDINSLREDPTNPNQMTEQEIKNLVQSIKQFGFKGAIIVRALKEGYSIIDGHQRFKAAKILEMKTIPSYVLEEISRTNEILLRQAMNKIRGTHNAEKDVDDIKRLLEGLQMDDIIPYLNTNETHIVKLLESSDQELQELKKKVQFEAGQKEITCPHCKKSWIE